VLKLPGGGGMGDPRERDPALVERDVADGLVGEEAARDIYRL
jgi:N-methylhydantoinase B